VHVLAGPILVLVQDNTDVFYFVRAIAIFLQNFTVVALLFGSKMWKAITEEDPHHGNSARNPSISLARPNREEIRTSLHGNREARISAGLALGLSLENAIGGNGGRGSGDTVTAADEFDESSRISGLDGFGLSSENPRGSRGSRGTVNAFDEFEESTMSMQPPV
jgi:hypothetical protein